MYCPKCRFEYKDGIERCPTCDMELVEQLPPAPAPPQKRKSLPTAALVAAIGIVVMFFTRSIATYALEAFDVPAVAAVAQILILLSVACVFYFFVVFLMEKVPPQDSRLRGVTILTVVASGYAALVHLKNLLVVLQVTTTPALDEGFIYTNSWSQFMTFFNAACLLAFFVVLSLESGERMESRVTYAARWAALGAAAMTIVALISLMYYFAGNPLMEKDRYLPWLMIALPFALFATGTQLYFLSRFFLITAPTQETTPDTESAPAG